MLTTPFSAFLGHLFENLECVARIRSVSGLFERQDQRHPMSNGGVPVFSHGLCKQVFDIFLKQRSLDSIHHSCPGPSRAVALHSSRHQYGGIHFNTELIDAAGREGVWIKGATS